MVDKTPFGWKIHDWEPLPYTEMEDDTDPDTGKRVYKTPVGHLPSMTTMLQCLDDGGIDAWVKRVGVEEAERIKTEASNRGNSLHDLNEAYLRNDLERSQIAGKGSVLFRRVRPYLDLINPVLACEIPLYSEKYGYAGRVDCVGYYKGKLAVIDHKNSRKPIDKSKSYARRKLMKYALQTRGYANCLEEMYGLKPKKGVIIVGNHETSNADVFEFSLEPLRKEFEIMVDIFYGRRPKEDSMYFSL